MTNALALALLLSLSAGRQGGEARLRAAQADFNRGNFDAALKTLDLGISEGAQGTLASRLQLLRGQVYAAQQQFPQAEQAFEAALTADPTATLDATRIDPQVVELLDSTRQRLKGILDVRVLSGRGGELLLDGTSLGQLPFRGEVPIGRHELTARSSDGRLQSVVEVVIRVSEPTVLSTTPDQPVPESAGAAGARSLSPFGDVRLSGIPVGNQRGLEFEVGGGVKARYLRASLGAKLFPAFGLTLRGALAVPVIDRVDTYVSLEGIGTFDNGVSFGIGGQVGIEYLAGKFVGIYAEAGARRYLTFGDNAFVGQAGVRLWLP